LERVLLEQKPKTLALRTLRQAEAGRARRRKGTARAVRKWPHKARRKGAHIIYGQNNQQNDHRYNNLGH